MIVNWYLHFEKYFISASKVDFLSSNYFFFHLAISLLALHPRETQAHVHKDTYTGIFIAALFTIAPNIPCTEWISELVCIHTMEYYTAKKMNEQLYVLVWINSIK